VKTPLTLRSLRPLASAVIVALATCGFVGWTPPAPAGAASNGLWSVFPTDGRGQAAREFVEPVLTPGHTYADSVTISNATATPLTVHTYASDAFNTPGGGLSLRRRTDVHEDIGKWITLATSELTVPAHGTAVAPFTIDTPPDASPGDHVGGIVAEQTQGTSSHAGSLPITVLEAVGVRVYARVVGPLHPRLSLHDTSLTVQQSAATPFTAGFTAQVCFTVTNSGNTVLSPSATVQLTTPLGTAARRTLSVGQVLPGNSLRYSVRVAGVRAMGRVHAEIEVADGSVRAMQDESAWAAPWALFGLVVLLVVMAAQTWIRYRRRRRTGVPPDAPDGIP
jgi:Bacterial protein of unknown function (DUF916)